MNPEELMGKIGELIFQWGKLHPDYELVVISLPKKDIEERNRLLKDVVGFLESERFE